MLTACRIDSKVVSKHEIKAAGISAIKPTVSAKKTFSFDWGNRP